MNKDIKKIIIVLALFSFSAGMFYNFREVWMQDNNLSLQSISNVLSISALLSVCSIFLFSNLLKENKLKSAAVILLFVKSLLLFGLFLFNHSGNIKVIKFLIMYDYVLNVEIYAFIYPLITFIEKNNKLYSIRDITYNGFFYGSIFIATMLLGRKIFYLTISYNTCCLISAIFIFIAGIILYSIDMNKYYKHNIKKDYNAFSNLLNKIKKDKISLSYLTYKFFGEIAYKAFMAMSILFLVNVGFSVTNASLLRVVMGIISAIFAYIVLKKLTLKNDYINIFIKFGVRFLLFLLSIIINNKIIFLITYFDIVLFSSSYTHITEAPYINRYNGKEQFVFLNIIEIIVNISLSLATLIFSLTIQKGIRMLFVVTSVFVFLQLFFAILSLKLRLKEKEL